MGSTNNRAIIIGGSLGGLFAGILLRSIGWDVNIYERSPHSLDSRGGGVVLQPEVVEAFQRAGVAYEAPLGVVARERIYLTKNGGVAQRMAMRQILTSWNMLYGVMRRHFPSKHYFQGKNFIEFNKGDDQVVAIFSDGTRDTGDLLIGADGPNSTVRQLLLPGCEPCYAGYVAYRGLVNETELDDEAAALMTERFVFYQFPNSHILQYVIPGEDESLLPGVRRFNWVWYVNYDERTELPRILTDKNNKLHNYSIPPGMIAPEVEEQMRSYANQVLPPPFQRLVAATKEAFVQAILDLGVKKMAFGRVALIGDAAFIPRPHTAASVSKGAANAIALVDALVANTHNVPKALAAWESEQLSLGKYLLKTGQSLGEFSQFAYGKERSKG